MNLDQMGPESAKSFRGQQVVRAVPDPEGTRPAERAKQESDYGRRGKGYIFGAFQPATGEAFTLPYGRRTIANWVDFLEQVDDWIPADIEHVYGIVDNLNVHRATDVLLFSLGRARWEFVFQPKYAAYLNLIEPWWKTLRSPASPGFQQTRCFSRRAQSGVSSESREKSRRTCCQRHGRAEWRCPTSDMPTCRPARPGAVPRSWRGRP